MEKNIWIKIIEEIFLKTKRLIDFLGIISVFCILLYRIEALRKICKAICQYFVNWYVDIELVTIKNIYFWFENIFRMIIVAFFIFAVLMWIIQLIWDWRLKKQRGKDRFEESVFRYLHDSNIPRCFLITGKWGSGKTYEVRKFFDKYYRHSKVKVFRISCFGLSSRKDLVKEISRTIEQEDNSFYALTIKVLQFLPVIGEPIAKLLKKSYGYDSVEKESIFIFDDFERITSRTITNEYSSHLYRKSSFLLSDVTKGRNALNEFKEIKKEFDSVQKAFSKVEDFVNKNSEREDFDKYIAIVGLINEIIEVYGMKVIIVCNSEILGEKFVHDILRSKLNCIEYRKTISSEARISIVHDILNNKTFDDKEKQAAVTEYLDSIKDDIEEIIVDTKLYDLRLFSGLLESFITTVVLFDKNMLTRAFMNSLFNSIVITHQAFYSNSIGELDMFVTGANIEMLMRLFGGKDNYPKLIRLNYSAEEVKWIDVSISGYWILNLSLPNNIVAISDAWKSYKYYKMEEKMCEDYHSFMSAQDYDLLHILFYQKELNAKRNEAWDCKSYIDKSLNSYDLAKIEDVQNILDIVGQAFSGRLFQEFLETLFEKLAEGHAEGKIVGHTYVHEDYIEFLQKKSLF
ncbi:P-loop NTPase fold protein [Kineothrix sp. MB12-C1]|uniref:P-loop NTPase fold protein n=1 Tax=Kineothrix sp. MB12-C1 TaxID=3070215 RepID=UPI0027D24072|nr:P-loop NTPase fold protein [Kineothrix sp. MB12-C1]WMC91969.1 P-loop NTPase fold protein [Kineothrix sp. MB12-C1]